MENKKNTFKIDWTSLREVAEYYEQFPDSFVVIKRKGKDKYQIVGRSTVPQYEEVIVIIDKKKGLP